MFQSISSCFLLRQRTGVSSQFLVTPPGRYRSRCSQFTAYNDSGASSTQLAHFRLPPAKCDRTGSVLSAVFDSLGTIRPCVSGRAAGVAGGYHRNRVPTARGPGGWLESPAQARRRGLVDIALCRVLSDADLRRSEAAALVWDDVARWDDGSGRLTVGRSKTDAEARTVYLTPALRSMRCTRRCSPG